MTTKIKTPGDVTELRQYARRVKSGCLEWMRSLVDGYGLVIVDGVVMGAHKYSYQISVGSIEPGKLVCHSCDNRKCIEPDHLFQGTHQDNADDMVRKGRSPNNRAAQNPNAKLTLREVRAIRKIGRSQAYVRTAKQFQVTPEMISNIVRNKYWKEARDDI